MTCVLLDLGEVKHIMNPENLPNIAALSCALLIAIACVLVLLFYFVARADNSPSPFHQNLAVGIFSIAVTTMVVLLGALPPTQDAVSKVAGKIGIGSEGVMTINVAGPAAIFIVILKITANVFRTKLAATAERAATAPVLSDIFESYYRRLGFYNYRTWFPQLRSFQRVIESLSEPHFIDDLLPKVFYHGPHGILKPQGVTNTTLFVFSGRTAVKFQRIRGSVQTCGDRCSQVYLPHTPSTSGGEISSMHFIRGGAGIKESAYHRHGEWIVPPTDDFDILLLAIYENDAVESGDYVYVDVSKYVDLESMDEATVELAIVSDRPVEEFKLWEVSASFVSTERPVPLMFKDLDKQANGRTVVFNRNMRQICEMFEGWDDIIDQAIGGKCGKGIGVSAKQVRDFLVKVKSVIAGDETDPATLSFHEFFRRPPAEDCVVCKLKHQRNVILSTFAWG